MQLSVQTAWLNAAVKEARKRAKVTLLKTEGFDKSTTILKLRARAQAVVDGLEGL